MKSLTRDNIKIKITNAFKKIIDQILRNVSRSFKERLQVNYVTQLGIILYTKLSNIKNGYFLKKLLHIRKYLV